MPTTRDPTGRRPARRSASAALTALFDLLAPAVLDYGLRRILLGEPAVAVIPRSAAVS